jgi:tRNA-2-methylthio-N6-dimethylallyladenosine synthase
LSGDFIVGFPGETDADFEQTLDLVREVKYAQAYSFKYSTRPGTPAADKKVQVPEDVKSDRLKRLQALLSQHQKEFMGSMVGRVLPVLLERPGRLDGQLVGRSEYLHGVHATIDQAEIGDVVNLRILGADTNSLRAEYVNK